MQAWIIHWKITNIPVHNTKYATRNNGNRCKEEIVAKSQYQEPNEENLLLNQDFTLTKEFNIVSPSRKNALSECILTIICN